MKSGHVYHENRGADLLSMCMLVLAMALAGSSVVVAKVLTTAMPVFPGAFASLVVAFVCMLPLMRGRWDEVRQLTRHQWIYLFLQGLCGIALFRVFTLYGLKVTGAVQAGIITGTTPAVLALLSFLMLGERITQRAGISILLAVGGCVALNLGGGREAAAHSTLIGCLLVFAAVVCEALFTIFRKRIAHSVSAITNTTVLIFCSLLLLLPPAFLEALGMQHLPDSSTLLALLYYGVFATVIAYLLWTAAVGKVSGSTAGVATAAMPASSVLLACLVLGEEVSFRHVCGCLMIVAGIVVSALPAGTGSENHAEHGGEAKV